MQYEEVFLRAFNENTFLLLYYKHLQEKEAHFCVQVFSRCFFLCVCVYVCVCEWILEKSSLSLCEFGKKKTC